MNSAWQNEIWRIAGLVLAGALFGYLVGNVALGVVLVLTVHIGWHLYNLNRLVRWLQEGKKFQPPEAKGSATREANPRHGVFSLASSREGLYRTCAEVAFRTPPAPR